MATTMAPERVVRTSPLPPFDRSRDHLSKSLSDMSDSPSLRSQPIPRGGLPPPNPPFRFPALPPTPAELSTTQGSTPRPLSAIESPSQPPNQPAENLGRPGRAALPAFSFNPGASNALPSFSFNPGASLPSEPLDAPFLLGTPPSPTAPPKGMPSPAARPTGHGHRRGGSEFVGGRLREGNSIAVMSTSPTKSESGFLTSTTQPRRSHRRGMSGAISTNDLPILQPPSFFDGSMARGSSAPTSPTGFDVTEKSSLAPSALDQQVTSGPEPVSKDEVVDSSEPTQTSSTESSPKQGKSGQKARVGFSDTLEFIPRPLSLVSNETSSTATARPGHSVSGSISSIVSAASPSGRGSPAPISRTPTRDSRPSTAGAILERTQVLPAVASSPKRRNSIPDLAQLADAPQMDASEPSPTRVSKRWSLFGRDASSVASSPTKSRPHSSGSSDSGLKTMSCSDHGSDTAGEVSAPVSVQGSKGSKKKNKKRKKKVKGWAGSILPRKPKDQTKQSQSDLVRPATPSAPTVQVPEDNDEPVEMLDEPELLEVSTPTVTVTESPDSPTSEEPPKAASEESATPMIDLDAALGPFNTPLPLNPEWEAAQRAAGNVGRRRLHSAQGMKGFSGPGMHYHRRAESAPDLPPFDPGRAGMHRYNSSSTMADVFEEDEEEDDATKSGSADGSVYSDSDMTPPAAISKDPMLDAQDKPPSTHSSAQSMRRTSSSLSDKEQVPMGSIRAERSKSSLHDSIIVEEIPSVIFRTPNNIVVDRMGTPESITPSARTASGSQDIDMAALHLSTASNAPNSPYAMSHSSSFPSPRSPMSVEVQRISTASSSVADENNFQSLLLMGEPGPEVRISMDYDIPSLTSSNSTMTRDSMLVPGQRMSQPALRGARPVSMSSAHFGRRRSSLASLSRLINSSHGERSKLSMEVPMDSEPAAKKPKTSRTKRLSRMMQFWRPHQKQETPSQQ